MKLPIITKETIKEHAKAVRKAKKQKTFKATSDKICEKMMRSNPELVEVIIPVLESKKSQEYKKGFLSGIATIYGILKRQFKKSK